MIDKDGYGRFPVLSRSDLERYCHLDDEDRRLIAARRRSDTRLGFAVQVVTVRNLGMFLADPLDVPPELVEYLAEQLGIDDPSCVKRYTEREKTKLEHAWEIQREYGLVAFAQVQDDLAAWIADRAWTTGDGPKAIFVGAIEWLRARNALLPGITTLEALIAEGRAAAEKRLWAQITALVGPGTVSALLRLLDVPDGAKHQVSELERLRKGVFRPSWKGMVKALRRLEDIQAVGIGAVDLGTVPPRRLTGLATYGLAAGAWELRRLKPREKQVAVLAATAKVMLARAVDDVLVFDLLMTGELLGKAERQSKEEKLRRFPRVSRNAGKLASAVKVLLEMVEVDQNVGLGVVWDLIEKTVTRSELRHAVEAIDELVPVGDDELDGQRLAELAGKLNTVKPFLPLMMEKVAFGATPEGAAVLAATKTLAQLLAARPTAKLHDRRGGLPKRRTCAGGHHHRRRLLQRHRLRIAAHAGIPVPAETGQPARSAAVALRRPRRLWRVGQGRAQFDRREQDRRALGRHVPGRGVDQHR